MNVQFKIGEVVNGWTIVRQNGLSEFVAENVDGTTICFNTDAGEGINYSHIKWATKNGRMYHAMRYLKKWVSVVQDLSNVLFDRYYEENMELFSEEDVEPLKEQDITHQWVVIKPKYMLANWKDAYLNKQSQVVFATGGFGCKGAALSVGGGKVFNTDIKGKHTELYRHAILGIAKPHVLTELNIPQPCPHCGKEEVLWALSRADNDTLICDDCGTREALKEYMG